MNIGTKTKVQTTDSSRVVLFSSTFQYQDYFLLAFDRGLFSGLNVWIPAFIKVLSSLSDL